MHVSSRNMFLATRNLQIRVHACLSSLPLLWRLIKFRLFCSDDCRSWPREEKINNHGCFVSTHTFLTMIIEESVCFMSCEPIFFCNYSDVVHTEYIYIFFSSIEQCASVIISPKEFKSWVTCTSFALLYGENRIICCQIFCDLLLKSALEWIFNVV